MRGGRRRRGGQTTSMYHERGKKEKRWTEEEVGRQHQRMDRAGVRQLPERCGEQEKTERAGCKVASDAPAIRTEYGTVK